MLFSNVSDCLADMKKDYELCGKSPLTDDCQALQRFCIKFEHLLQTGLKGLHNLSEHHCIIFYLEPRLSYDMQEKFQAVYLN
jgi:hypothetical protein